MAKTQRIRLTFSFAMFLGAVILAGTFGQVSVKADDVCWYAGQEYSIGACLRSVCDDTTAQRCIVPGTWTDCQGCYESH
jgi:hypothetical protein